jgi:HSP20 family protein
VADVTIRSPLQELTDRLNRLFDETWLHTVVPADWGEGSLAVDVSENEQELTVRASLPGFAEHEIEVHVDAGVLSIKARHEESHKEQQDRYYRRERVEGAVSRRVALPGVVSDAEVYAELDKGVLTIRIPRTEAAKPKKIEIKSTGS